MANSGNLSNIFVSLQLNVQVAPQNLSPDIEPWIQVSGSGGVDYSFGSVPNFVNTAYSYKRTIPSSASADTFAISGTALIDPAGNKVGFAHIAAFRFANLDSTETITIKAAATDGVTFLPSGGITLPPGAQFLWFDPKESLGVVAGSSDRITASISAGTNVAYIVEILGCDS
jgi:hypothetical protein